LGNLADNTERTFVPENRAAAPTIEPPPASAWHDAAATFGLLSSTARLRLLWELARREHDVGSLAAATGHRFPAVSQHLGKRTLAGMVFPRWRGMHSVYVVTDTDVMTIVGVVIARAAMPSLARQHSRRSQPATRVSAPQPIRVS
jgi:DNA-binding transcriptional ArsR family regulator